MNQTAPDATPLQRSDVEEKRPRRLATRMQFEDGLPALEPLCDRQASIAQAYAELIEHGARIRESAEGARGIAYRTILDRLRQDALWAVTEVERDHEFKLRRQRYISQDVFDRWTDLCSRCEQHRRDRRQARHPTLRDFCKDASGGTLAHEHVFRREVVAKTVKNLTTASAIRAELLKLKACVVTSAEHDRLGESTGDGWDRYASAGRRIGVYDRLEKRWCIDRS